MRRAVYDARALPAELERDGCQMAACSLHDNMSHVRAAGEEYVVPADLQKVGVRLVSSLYDLNKTGVELLVEHLLERPARRLAVARGLEDDAAACGQGRGKRHQCKHDRIVPWAHDEHDALGLLEYV